VYLPDVDLCDGAAQAHSKGFFDVYNAPPWDTWVAMLQDSEGTYRDPYLISWVPPEFASLAQNGIDVNPEQCIVWLEDTTLQIRHHLHAQGAVD
jgi:hypothetical protein